MKPRTSFAQRLFSMLLPLLVSLPLGAQDLGGGLWHTLKNGENPWSQFVDVRGEIGAIQFVDVSVARRASGDLDVIASDYDGNLWHTIRYPNGTWLPFEDVTAQTGQPGHCDAVATAVSGDTLHLVAQSYGMLWYAARKANGVWTKFQAVDAPWTDAALLDFRDISVSVAKDGELHIVAAGGSGNLLHTFRRPGGQWGFENVSAQAGAADAGYVASAFLAGKLNVVIATNVDGELFHT